MGYKPAGESFKLKNGVFYNFCIEASNNPNEDYFFIIDEINRGNLSKIFGELLGFHVPDNVYIIGMMGSMAECNANYEFLLYLLKEMQNGMKTVEQLKKEVAETKLPQATKELFYKVLDTADESRLSESQRMRYESDLKNYMDTMSCIEFAEIKGKAEGRAEEKAAIAKSMKEKGIAASLIAECTGIPEDVIEQL